MFGSMCKSKCRKCNCEYTPCNQGFVMFSRLCQKCHKESIVDYCKTLIKEKEKPHRLCKQ